MSKQNTNPVDKIPVVVSRGVEFPEMDTVALSKIMVKVKELSERNEKKIPQIILTYHKFGPLPVVGITTLNLPESIYKLIDQSVKVALFNPENVYTVEDLESIIKLCEE